MTAVQRKKGNGNFASGIQFCSNSRGFLEKSSEVLARPLVEPRRESIKLCGDTMKKSFIALAVAGAFSSAAFAQSSVTIYGRVDVGLQKVNDVAAGNSPLSGAVASDSLNVVQGSGSRLGFQGTEDLGSGLKALFQIEHRFDPDTGNVSAAAFWNGRSYVGLAGSFGTVKLGREYTPAFWVGIAADPWGYDTIGQVGTGPTLAGSSAVRFANVVSYKSPNFGGLNFEAAYVPSEVASTPAVGDKDGFGFNVTWSGGPIYVGLGYEDNVQASSAANNVKLWNLTGTYNFGVAKIFANYANGKTTPPPPGVETTNKAWSLAAAMPLGAGEARVGLSQVKTDPTNTKVSKIGLGYHYSLSKRTTLYTDFGRAKQSSPDLSARSGFDFGIKHNF